MSQLKELFESFSELASVSVSLQSPTDEAFRQANAALGFALPEDFVLFLKTFHDRQPPFWQVLRVAPPGGVADGEDIVETNKRLRAEHPEALSQSVVFRDIGTGDYECFVYSPSRKLLGIGLWEQYEGADEEPSVLYDSFEEWLANEIETLREA